MGVWCVVCGVSVSVVPYFYECYLYLVKSVKVNNRKADAHSIFSC